MNHFTKCTSLKSEIIGEFIKIYILGAINYVTNSYA